jgi:signal transduction histidine kinase
VRLDPTTAGGRDVGDGRSRAEALAQHRGDAQHLQRVLRNLLDNAARHATGKVTIDLRGDGEHADLLVSDDGPGIPAADRERVFDRFVRLDDARSRDGGGSGLGLAIARGIVAEHGGTLTVDDAPAGGAALHIRLPC